MKKTIKKNVTLDDLAIMVGNGFNAVDKRLASVESDISFLKGAVKKVNQDVLNIGDRFVPRYEFDGLLIRVGKLEEKARKN